MIRHYMKTQLCHLNMRHIHFFCGCVLLLAVFCQGQTVTLQSSSTAVEGDSFRLTCTVTGGPDPSTPVLLSFRYGDTDVCRVNSDDCSEIQSKPRFSCGAVSCGNGHTRVYFLDINPISRQDDRDDWSCQYNAVLSTGSLTVNYPPSMKPSFPSTYTVIEKKRLNIDCSTFTTPGQPPTTSYEWTHPGGSTTSILDISSINRSQRGQYTCTAMNTLSPGRQGKDNAAVDVNVQYGPKVSGIRTSFPVAEFSSLQVNCSTYTTPGNPTTTSYRWTGPYSFSGPVLSITSIRRNQAGRYACTASNTLTPTDGSQATGSGTGYTDVQVQYLDNPVLTVDMTEVQEYDTVVFMCQVASYPTVQMTITHTENNTILVEETTNHKQVTISRAQCLHNGTYLCSVYNRRTGTTTTSSRSLSVMCFPRHDFRVRLNNFIEKDYNQAAVLIADFISNPAPNYTWYRYNGQFSPVGSQTVHRVINTKFQTRLQINIINSKDYGIYAAVAQNSIGINQIRFSLTPTSEVTGIEHRQPVSRSYTMEAIFGSVYGVLVVVIIIGVGVLYRKGYVCSHPVTNGRIQQKRQQAQEDERAYAAIAVESQPNTTYSGLEIRTPQHYSGITLYENTKVEEAESQPNATYSGLEIRTPQHYSGLTLYENTKDEATLDPAVYDRLRGKTPVTYESLELHAYENTSHEIKDPSISEMKTWHNVFLLFQCQVILVAGVVTVTSSGTAGIPNQQDLILRCRYTTDEIITGFRWSRKTGNSPVVYKQIHRGTVFPQRSYFQNTWENKGVFRGNYTSTLDIELPANHVTANYAGTYRCQVNGISTIGINDVTVAVFYRPSVSGIPNPYQATENTNLMLNCSVYTRSNPAVISYMWSGPSGYNSSGPVLSITNITRDKSGQYICTATNSIGTNSEQTRVDVQYTPSITGIRDPYDLTENTNLQLDCSVFTQSNPPVISYIWSGPGGYSGIGPVLSITNINRNRSGQYMCTATNTLTPTGGSSMTGIGTSNITVDVQYLDSPLLNLDRRELTENDTVTISCDVVSNPEVQMTITNRDNNTVLVEETTNNKQVTMNRAQCLHNGTYVCSVYNHGTNTKITSSRSLSVLCSPRHDYREKLNTTITKANNQVAVLIADFISNPVPNFTWYRYDGTMSPVGSQTIHRVINTEFQTTLQINITHSRDYGNYVVVAQNGIGSSEIRYSLKEAKSATLLVSSSSTTAISGGVVGGLVFAIIIVAVVILYRKGYGCRSPITNDRTQKNGQQVEDDNRAYATIGEPRESQANKTYSGLEHGTPQHYTGLTLHENTTDETETESAVSLRLQDKTPVTYEGLELHAYENTSHGKMDPTYTNTTGQ